LTRPTTWRFGSRFHSQSSASIARSARGASFTANQISRFARRFRSIDAGGRAQRPPQDHARHVGTFHPAALAPLRRRRGREQLIEALGPAQGVAVLEQREQIRCTQRGRALYRLAVPPGEQGEIAASPGALKTPLSARVAWAVGAPKATRAKRGARPSGSAAAHSSERTRTRAGSFAGRPCSKASFKLRQ